MTRGVIRIGTPNFGFPGIQILEIWVQAIKVTRVCLLSVSHPGRGVQPATNPKLDSGSALGQVPRVGYGEFKVFG